ncbi:hypothetical protein C5S30_04260 [ANME-1 cluster archaeon GoMg4]|nr:hypothetical protein [ANME-1 cluster archaeon GoMg4]
MNKKGVSEVVGYVLTFGIVVVIVTVIYASGMPVVEDMKDKSAFQSMETSFVTLQSNVKKVAFGQSPLRTMKFNLVKGSIGANDHTAGNSITVTVDGNAIPLQFGNIEYTIGTRRVVYELGAVIESTPGGNIIISDPPIFFTNYSGNKNVFISVINVSGGFSAGGGMADMQIGGLDGLYNVTRDTNVYNSSDYVNTLDIDVSGQYRDAWERYLCEAFDKTPPLPITISDCNLTLVTHNVSIS